MDMQKIPAVQQKRIVTFVNNFLIDTITSLNRLVNSSEDLLWRLEKRMMKLETTVKLLETKLSCISDLVEENDLAVEENTLVANIVSQYIECDSKSSEDVSSDLVDTTGERVPPEVDKYRKMVQFGVPVEAVKLKMQRDGFNSDLLT